MILVKRVLCICGAGLLGCAWVQAQVDTTTYHRLSEVEVMGKARPSVTREATPLQLMDRAGIERLGVQDLSEAVKRFSGVTVKDYGGIGGLKTVSVRSLGAQHTAVSYDGVTVSDVQSGQVDISRFSLDNVEMISLSIGQGDDIFQSARLFASAGALQIKTSRPRFDRKPFNIRAKVKGGSFGLFNPVLQYEQKLGNKWSASAYIDGLRADGQYPFTVVNGDLITKRKRKNSDIRSLRLEGNVYGDLGKGGSLSFKGYYFDSQRGLPGSITLYKENTPERLWNNNFFLQAHYQNRVNEKFAYQGFAKYNYSFSRYQDLNDKYASGMQEDRNTENEYYVSGSLLYTPSSYWSGSFSTDYTWTSLDNNFVKAPSPRRSDVRSSLALQYKHPRLTLTGSLLGTYVTDQVENGDRPADRKRLSPAVSASWRPFEENAFRARLSYKDIFRVPTFTDLYYLRMGNTNLRPEKATLYNAGVTWSGEPTDWLRYLSISADGYFNRVKDKIVVLPALYVAKMMNLGEVNIGGVDANVSAEFPLPHEMSLMASVAYTWQKAIDVTNSEDKNYKDQIPYTPRHSGTTSLTFTNPWVNITYNVTAVGERYSLPQNIEENRIDSYVEQNVSLNRTFKIRHCSLRLQGEVLNLGGVNYDIIQYYPMPGRSWRLSVSLNY